MGPQWVYLSIINAVAIAVIATNKVLAQSVRNVFKANLKWVYIALFLVAGLSITGAVNKTESFVTYARFASAITAFLCLGILLNNRLHLLKWLVWFFSGVLLIQSFSTLQEFLSKIGDDKIDAIILGLKGNAGNKNILAASLVIKLPFLLYLFHSAKNNAIKIALLVTLFLTGMSVFILNARSTYLSFSGNDCRNRHRWWSAVVSSFCNGLLLRHSNNDKGKSFSTIRCLFCTAGFDGLFNRRLT